MMQAKTIIVSRAYKGQIVALDMLFAPEWAMLEPPHALWREIQMLAPRLRPSSWR